MHSLSHILTYLAAGLLTLAPVLALEPRALDAKTEWCTDIYCNCVFGSNTMDCVNKFCNGATQGWGSCAVAGTPSGYTPDAVLGNICCTGSADAAESCLARAQYNANQGGYCTSSRSPSGGSSTGGGGSGGSGGSGSGSSPSASSSSPASTVSTAASATKSSAAGAIIARNPLGHFPFEGILGTLAVLAAL